MTDWLQIMVQEEAIRDPSHSAAKEALNHLDLKPRDAFAVAASRFVKLSRATVSEANRPHNSEAFFFPRYASVEVFLDLVNRFCSLVEKSSITAECLWAKYSHTAVKKHSDHPINKSDPMESLMQSRGQVSKKLFSEFVDSIQMHHCQFLKSQIAQQTTNIWLKQRLVDIYIYIYTDSILLKKGGKCSVLQRT